MEKISELMDGELEADQCNVHIRRLAADAQLGRRWDHYHLIRDVLRAETGTRVDLVASVRARLEAEPTVLAPRRRLPEMAAHIAVPIAAAVAGVLIGGWLAAPSQQGDMLAGTTAAVPAIIAAPSPKAGSNVLPAQDNGQAAEYVLAHQEVMQGGAPFAHVPFFKDADSAQ
jgi:sigma-E factor negative regulatory protein RseA